jgi:hypothetical protein
MREPLPEQPRKRHAPRGRPVPSLCGSVSPSAQTGLARGTGASLPRAPFCALAVAMLFAALVLGADPAAAGPGRTPWVGLGKGRMGDVLWSVKLARPSVDSRPAAQTARRPCLRVGTKWELNRYDYQRSNYQGCADPSTRLSATGAPLLVSGAQASRRMRVKLTAVGMVVGAAARRVLVTLEDGTQMTIPLKKLSPEQQQMAGHLSIRYAAFAVSGSWAVRRLVTQSRSGTTLWDSESE